MLVILFIYGSGTVFSLKRLSRWLVASICVAVAGKALLRSLFIVVQYLFFRVLYHCRAKNNNNNNCRESFLFFFVFK